MPTNLIYTVYALFFLPLLAAFAVPIGDRYAPRYPLVGSRILAGLLVLVSFGLLAALSENSTGQHLRFFRLGLYLDQLTAAALFILSISYCQTILCSSQKWCSEGGFLSLFLFSLTILINFCLLLSDNILQCVIFWILIDLCSYVGEQKQPGRKKDRQRFTSFIYLQAAGFFLLGTVVALVSIYGTTSFTLLAQLEDPSSVLFTWILWVVCLGVGMRTAGFSRSLWDLLAQTTTTSSTLPHFSLIYGICAVLPGVYLLSRIFPWFAFSQIPIPLILATTVALGFIVFPLLEGKESERQIQRRDPLL